MSLPLIIVRPEPGASATAARAAALGLAGIIAPLFAAEPRAWTPPKLAGLDALLVTSANAVRLAGPQLAALAALPVHAVGEASADAARAAGLTVAHIGDGGAQPLVDALVARGARALLWLTGTERTALASGPARITPIITYAMPALPPPPAWGRAIAEPGLLLLHSARAAARASALAGAARNHLIALAISGPVAAAVGTGWKQVVVASSPDDAAMLALAAKLCQTKAA
jgi:uroporphyrinogen-III synthase